MIAQTADLHGSIRVGESLADEVISGAVARTTGVPQAMSAPAVLQPPSGAYLRRFGVYRRLAATPAGTDEEARRSFRTARQARTNEPKVKHPTVPAY